MKLSRKQLLYAVGSAALSAESALAADARIRDAEFSLRGVYFHDGFDAEPKAHAPLYWDFNHWKLQLDWLRHCGINAVEYATMLEFNRLPSTDLERRKIDDKLRILDYAHQIGLKFGYLLTNTVMSTVPVGEEPGHQQQNRATTLCPRVPGNVEKTIAIPRFFMDTFRKADFFEEFAADWGGCTCGECGVDQYLRYVKDLAGRLTEVHNGARIYADTWCISFWHKDPMSDGWKGVFDREITGSRTVIDALHSLPANVDLALPCHHLYRPLAFEAYGGKSKTPEFPTRSDVERVRAAGRDVLAWTHFVMDDDAYRAKSWGIVHSEVRYIQALLRSLQSVGIHRVIGNLYLPWLQLSNTYAYGRLLHNPNLQPTEILHDFAKLVADRRDVGLLTEALIWLENRSYWHQQMPYDARLAALPGSLNAETAADAISRIRPNTKPSPLPTPPEMWLADLSRSVKRMRTTA